EKEVDKKLYPYILFYSGSIKDYKSKLDFDGKDVPYFYVLDENGKIVYNTSGMYTTSKMQEIVDRLPF
ncbi:MAG: flagellar basal body rod protein FlgG, partial [Gammaproteobacteria bacterium]